MKSIISTPNAPAAIGAYSQAVVINGMLYASGQLGIDPTTGNFAGEDFRSQAEQSLKNVGAILAAAGSSFEKVVKVSVFMADMADFATLNELYSQYFVTPFPARSAVAVKTLPKNGLIEIEVVAEV
ncbi:MAG: RidA family protein [Bacteroidales bacterium]|nr:RidA family protein [Candidatus Liminaster caballi]